MKTCLTHPKPKDHWRILCHTGTGRVFSIVKLSNDEARQLNYAYALNGAALKYFSYQEFLRQML